MRRRSTTIAILLWVVIVGLIFLGISECSKGATWQSTSYNSGVTIKQSSGNECYFMFPGSGHVNLIARKWTNQIPKGATISITYQISVKSGAPQFKSLDPAPAPPSLKPNFRPMLFNGDWAGASSRFWPAGGQCAWLIADGQIHTYTIKVDPKLWTNVWGQYDAGGFKNLLKHLYQIHLAFGGGNSFSHGIKCVNGTAQFTLIKFSVQ